MHFKISIKQKTEMELPAQAFTNSLINRKAINFEKLELTRRNTYHQYTNHLQ